MANYRLRTQNVLQFMKNYTKVKVIRLTEVQHSTLVKMKSLNVDVGNFIREAIREKIVREYDFLTQKDDPLEDDFAKGLRLAIEKHELNK